MSPNTLTPESVARFCAVPGLSIQVREEVTSTNTLLKTMAETGAAEGTVLLALRQTAGRGRRDHTFFSPPDTGLYLSLLVKPDLPAQEALLLTTCAAASVALAVEDCAGVPAQIKWVNDVFCRDKKVCGILTEAALDLDTGGLQYAVVGIGVNLFPPEGGFPPDLPEAGAVFETPQEDEVRSRLAGRILERFFAFYKTLRTKPFWEDYQTRSLVLGRSIWVLERGQKRPAVAVALNDDGSLRVREADGTFRDLTSGEVSVRPAEG